MPWRRQWQPTPVFLPGKSHGQEPGRMQSMGWQRVKHNWATNIFTSLHNASLVAQLVKNPPAMQETWVRSLGWEDPLEKGKATYSGILAWRIPWTVQSMGHKELDMTEQLSLIHIYVYIYILLKFFSTVVYYKIVNIFPCATKSLLLIYILYSSLYLFIQYC